MVDFIEEMSQDFLDYCYQTNAERAFPAIDGLKPGQRACLYEMYLKGYTPSKPHVKSAKVSGAVIASLWPHGSTAIYETFARMAQPFVNNVPLCEFHGSCGNQIIPEPAADRYTEVRLSKMGLSMFNGIKKKNVPFILNFDETLEWPEVLPSTLPWLMINGSEGIGTTLAQRFLSYDLKEVSEAYRNYLLDGTLDYTLAPSFPTGGIIINKNDLPTILKTGKGKVILRARAEIKKNTILITEICYQTCVRDLMDEFKKLFEKEELDGIEDIQNLSGKQGICIKVICEKSADPQKILNMLYRKTSLEKSYSANQNILIGKVPQLVNMEQYFSLLKKHNKSCLIRECQFDLNKDTLRQEECKGFLVAFADIDNVITIVRNSEDKSAAKAALIAKYNFTEHQADTILKMTIGQLTKLDGNKLKKELETLAGEIEELNSIINSEDKQIKIITDNIADLAKQYKGKRTTDVIQMEINKEIKEAPAIIPEDVVVILTQSGDIKRVPRSSFKIQKRNGKGARSMNDAIMSIISTNTIDTLILFTNVGRMYRIAVDTVPSASNAANGVKVSSLINFTEKNEKVIGMTSLNSNAKSEYAVFFTKRGLIKKTYLNEYFKMKKSSGVVAIKLSANDSIANVEFMSNEKVMLVTKQGISLYIDSSTIAPIGRVTMGVKGITLAESDELLYGLPVRNDNQSFAVFTTKGEAKRVNLKDYAVQLRAGKGVKCTVENNLAAAMMVTDEDNILAIGTPNTICFSASEIPIMSRTTIGNQIIKNSVVNNVVKL